MSHIPYRTGLTSIRILIQQVCRLIQKYQTVIFHVLPEEQHVYVNALLTACENFLQNTDNPRP